MKSSSSSSEVATRTARKKTIKRLIDECELKTFAELYRRAHSIAQRRYEHERDGRQASNYERILRWVDDDYHKCLANGHSLYELCLTLFIDVFADCPQFGSDKARTIADLQAQLWPPKQSEASAETADPDRLAETRSHDPWAPYKAELSGLIDLPAPGCNIPLSLLYVPLRASYGDTLTRSPHLKSFLTEKQKKSADHRTDLVNVVDDLEALVETWLLNDIETYDLVRLIRGGPGSGKSTFTKHLVSRIVRHGTASDGRSLRIAHVILIPLQHAPVGLVDMTNVIGDRLARFGLADSDFKPDLFRPDGRLLVVFDGLDELSREGASALEQSRAFIKTLQNWLAVRNSVHVNTLAIVVGRDMVVQKAEATLALAPHQTWELQPYLITKRGLLGEDRHLLPDQRPIWWRQWAEANGLDTRLPFGIRSRGLTELSTEPLLLYIIALTGIYESTGITSLSRFELYEFILKRIISNWHNRAGRKDVQFLADPAIAQVLENIAIAAWIDGGRATSASRAISVSEPTGTTEADLRRLISEGEVVKALLAFYMRLDDDIDNVGIEFSHKSFCEFLVIRYLSRTATQVLKSGGGLIMLFDRVEGLASQPMTDEMAGFLHDAVLSWPRPQIVAANRSALDLLRRIASGERLWHGRAARMEMDFIVEVAIVILASTGPLEGDRFEIEWSGPCDAQALLSIIGSPDRSVLWHWRREYTSLVPEVIKPSASRLIKFDFSGQSFIRARFVALDLTGSSLENCDLRGAEFIDCIACSVSFDRSNLQGTRWHGTNISNATFRRAVLDGADFSLANGISPYQFTDATSL
ncbi:MULTISPECIES: pentapeptide repeat-containing protein [unclassified Bradyrhizobium]|uniref:NACHT domain-containing protein n=1 Tax=unclassified Bradyrhizobium TaxID=2631580 RepID=UPI0024E16780|nr:MULTISPECIES: pentapeptide repeat-containing protein [unclassified Bradyrhizobium]